MNRQATVYVVDDDVAVRKSLQLLMESVGLTVETYESAAAFLQHVNLERVGCLVLDVRMPGMSGLELQRHMRNSGIDLPVIIVTGHGDVPIAVRAMKEGALEFLEKPFSKQVLLELIHKAINEHEQIRRHVAQHNATLECIARLTDREREVMDLVVEGKLSKQVAAELGISKKTVDVHRARVMRKLEAESLPQLVKLVLASRGELRSPAV